VPIKKLRDYCLDTNHPAGGHKAFEVEFRDGQGRTLAFASLNENQLLQPHPPRAVRRLA
jgi:hypothetical protein